jgi:hypothetical protein
MRAVDVIAASMLLMGCATGEPVVAGSSQDSVQIEANGALEPENQSRADQACATHQRSTRMLSQRCGDGCCSERTMPFACVPRSDS